MSKTKKPKAIPTFIPIEKLSDYVETGTEVPKETLISRIAGRVDLSILTLFKLLGFHSIRKDQDGNLSLL